MNVGDFGIGSELTSSTTNLDTYFFGGWVSCLGAATGAPNSSEGWYVSYIGWNTSVGGGSQIAIGANTGKIKTRIRRSNNWQAWEEAVGTTLVQTLNNKSFGTAMMPASNNAIDIGSASVRTRDIFTVNAVNVLSNAQHKQDVRSMTAQELACAQELAQNISLFRWKDAVAGKGENARIHIGMIAQEVVTIFLKHGLCANDYGLLCFDSWVAETVEHEAEYEQIEIPAVTEVRLISEAVLDKDGNEQEPAVYEIVELEPARIEQGEIIAEAWTETVKDAGEAYSLRTEELLYFIMAGQEARMKNIEERLTLLE
ncbi:MAG: tail fiber domain-containing protein [Geovibrio sp.]|nr:tail fiber domain-containing protein [Geovibrio sp.]